MSEETIVLPKSGVVLTQDPEMSDYPYLSLVVGTTRFRMERVFVDGSKWRAIESMVKDGLCLGSVGQAGSRDECLAWLDERVLELRRALMPEDAKNRVATVLFSTRRFSLLENDALADAVLTALGVSK
jgi:hypothetical protein